MDQIFRDDVIPRDQQAAVAKPHTPSAADMAHIGRRQRADGDEQEWGRDAPVVLAALMPDVVQAIVVRDS